MPTLLLYEASFIFISEQIGLSGLDDRLACMSLVFSVGIFYKELITLSYCKTLLCALCL